MATTACAATVPLTPLSSTSRVSPLKPSALPIAQVQNGGLKVRASLSEEHISRREAMTVAAAGGLAGLLLLVPVGSAEARNTKPETRKKIREEIEKIKEAAAKAPEAIKKEVAKVAKK